MSIDDRTSRLNLPLPNQDNFLEEDVQRLRDALSELDAKVATVDGTGKVPVEQLPDIAITNTFEVSNEAAMLALAAQPGDFAIRNDLSLTFILKAEPASNINNWQELINDALEQLGKADGYEKVGGLVENFASLDAINDFNGELTASPAETPVPSHSDPDLGPSLNAQAQALLNRQEKFKQDLASSQGGGFIGFSAGDAELFSFRTIANALKDSLWFDDFKGATDDEKWASLAAYVSSVIVTSVSVTFSARPHLFTVKPAKLTKPFSFSGMGRRSTILKFTGCDGISADLSAYGSRYIQSRIAHMSLVAESSNAFTGIYFKGAQSFAPHDPALVLDDISLFGLRDISPSSDLNNEWAIAIHLDDADEVHLKDVYIAGSGRNGSYSTRSTSKGIFANTVTGLRMSSTNIYLCGNGVEVTGQSEGAILCGLTIVAVDTGILFRDLVNPSNNHVISDTHISAYTKGVEFRKHADQSTHPTAVFMSKMFFLEREGVATKPQYIAIECYAIRSVISDVTIQSNNITSPVRRALVVSNQNNFISNIHCLNAGAILYIDNVAAGYVYYSNIRGVGDLVSLLSGNVEFAVGGGLMNSAEPTSYNFRADTFRTYDVQGREQYSSSGGRHMFGGGRHNASVYHDFRTLSGGTAAYDGRILFSGGSPSVTGQADAVIYAKNIAFAGHLASETANAFTCGTAGRPWAGGFTQTAFTVTSDERAKTEPLEITDAMLDAWSEVDWCQYKLLDRVADKGDAARWHHGIIAQRAVEAFERHGLDSHDYGFMCYDEWEAQDEVVVFHEATPDLFNAEGDLVHPGAEAYSEVVTPARAAGSRYSIRYEEAFALEAALQRRNYERLLKRIEALEAK